MDPLPNDNFLDWSNLKALADKKNITQKEKFFLGWVEYVIVKR